MAPEDKTDEPVVETVVPEPAPALITPEPEEKKTAVIVVSGTSIPPAGLKIVTEARTYSKPDDETGAVSVEVKKSNYPSGADLYVRYDPDVQFPKDSKVVTVGVDVQQFGFGGFTRQVGMVNVGPAHPAFVAANLAYQQGATNIRIVGLTDEEKERLRPFFDDLPRHAVEPAQVTVSFA